VKRISLAIMLTLWAAALAGCGGGNTSSTSSSSGGGGSTACPAGSGSSGGGASVSVGSKGFAEEQLLASMTVQVLNKHGFSASHSLEAKDTAIGNALSSGQIDMLWQYTGTELSVYLKLTNFPRDLHQAFEFVKKQDEPRGLCWTSEAPLNDTNGLAIKASDKGTYGSTLSDFGNYLASHPNTKICIMSEFRTRPDGLPGLEQTYNQSYANASYTDLSGTAEKNIANGDCAAGEVFTTDSPIAANNLYVLQDNKNLFPPDNVGLVVRSEVLKAHPAIAALMAPVAAKLTSAEITKLNKAVEIDNQKLDDVARTWLQQNGFL